MIYSDSLSALLTFSFIDFSACSRMTWLKNSLGNKLFTSNQSRLSHRLHSANLSVNKKVCEPHRQKRTCCTLLQSVKAYRETVSVYSLTVFTCSKFSPFFLKKYLLNKGLCKCQRIWERGGCNPVLDMFWCVVLAHHSRLRRSEWHDRGKCLRQAWINMLRQDTESLPLFLFFSLTHCLSFCLAFSIFYSCSLPSFAFLIPLLLTLPPMFTTRSQPLGISKHPGSRQSNLNI